MLCVAVSCYVCGVSGAGKLVGLFPGGLSAGEVLVSGGLLEVRWWL